MSNERQARSSGARPRTVLWRIFRPRTHILLVAIGVLAWVGATQFMIDAGVLRQIVAVTEFGDVSSQFDPADLDFFRDRLSVTEIPTMEGREQLIALMSWVMNNIAVVGPHSSSNPVEIFEEGRALCGGMALVYSAAAQSLGFSTREIDLVASPGNRFDTHVLTEVKVDGRWEVFDPTFNTTYVDEMMSPLGVAEIQSSIYDSASPVAEPVFHGEVSYGARLDEYPTNWQVLFANAYAAPKVVADTAIEFPRSKMRFVPIHNVFFGSKKYYLSKDGALHRYGKTFNAFYFLTMLILPVLILASSVMFVGGLCVRLWSSRAD